jgi:hypothetical protein
VAAGGDAGFDVVVLLVVALLVVVADGFSFSSPNEMDDFIVCSPLFTRVVVGAAGVLVLVVVVVVGAAAAGAGALLFFTAGAGVVLSLKILDLNADIVSFVKSAYWFDDASGFLILFWVVVLCFTSNMKLPRDVP